MTTDSDAGPGGWSDRTGGINPSEYDVSDIVISQFDATGGTAYAAIMGFGVAHVFKTTNAGVSWMNKSGNLPDVPVNSLAIDPANSSLLYAGTDAGVFVSADDGTTWAELGSGLPNVPVVKLLTLVSGNTRKLRAASIGRGVWQIDLPVVAVKVAPAALMLNATVVGRSSPAQSVVLTNDSAGSLTFNNISTTGPFAITHNCTSPLPVESGCQVSVTFLPSAGGLQSGTLTMSHTSGVINVPLSAMGVDFSLLLSRPVRTPRSASSGIVLEEGAPVTLELVLQLTAPEAEGEVLLSCESPTRTLICSVTPQRSDLAAARIPIRVTLSYLPPPGRARRLSRLTGDKSMSYAVTVRAVSGSASRIVQVPVRTR